MDVLVNEVLMRWEASFESIDSLSSGSTSSDEGYIYNQHNDDSTDGADSTDGDDTITITSRDTLLEDQDSYCNTATSFEYLLRRLPTSQRDIDWFRGIAKDWLRRHSDAPSNPDVDLDHIPPEITFPYQWAFLRAARPINNTGNMDGFDNEMLMEWEAFFESIRIGQAWIVDLTGSRDDRYGLSNDRLMSRMRPRLVDALRSRAREHGSVSLFLGSKFLSTMTTDAQQSFFDEVCTLPFVTDISLGDGGLAQVAIHTPALLHALSGRDGQLRSLCLHNFALASSVLVQQLADIIVANKDTLFGIHLANVECPVHYNERLGFLDPIFDALSQLQDNRREDWINYRGKSEPLPSTLVMSSRTHPTSSLVSPKSLRSFLGSAKVKRKVELTNMGLSDSHCLAIAEHAHTLLANGDNRKGWKLNLHSNPSITEDGYKALVNAAYSTRDFPKTILDDKRWEDEINFVCMMNRRLGRFDYLDDDGAFPSRERLFEWLNKAANFPKKSDPLSCIYCTLREHPDFITTPSSIPSER